MNQIQLHHVACLEPQVREDLLAMGGIDRLPRHVMYGDGSPIADQTMAVVGRVYEECAVCTKSSPAGAPCSPPK